MSKAKVIAKLVEAGHEDLAEKLLTEAKTFLGTVKDPSNPKSYWDVIDHAKGNVWVEADIEMADGTRDSWKLPPASMAAQIKRLDDPPRSVKLVRFWSE